VSTLERNGGGALLTDLYELGMLDVYFERGMTDAAVFELFVRKLPKERAFLVAAGLEHALDFLEGLELTDAETAYLASSRRFSADLVERLRTLRFRGDVDAVPEGTIVFADEPLVRVTACLPEAQIVESRLINIVHMQTLIASKAARSVLVSRGKRLVDFGMRRAHGLEAALAAARASYIAGFDGTSTLLAGLRFGIPVYGTMAHSFVQAFRSERDAFDAFARSAREPVVLLIDTYDTEAAAHTVAELAPALARDGIQIDAVRIDSGNLAEHARRVREILDQRGLERVRIFASGGLSETSIADLVRNGAPIDGFGIGTKLDTSADAPYLDCAYKLVQYANRPCRKRSEGKANWPGPKQVYRRRDDRGAMQLDTLTLADEPCEGDPLLVPVMRRGRRLDAPEPLSRIRERAKAELASLPTELTTLEPAPSYPVRVSPALVALAERVDREQRSYR
jgi:nicotinate phosphoribosyltransferase